MIVDAYRQENEYGRHRTYVLCKCKCGNVVEIRYDSLTTGNTRSCGCEGATTQFKSNDLTGKVNAYDCICIEDLDMKAMSRSLNFGKSVSDNGWGMFTTFLRYKLEEQGKKLVKVGRFFASSQTCSICGYKNVKTKNLALREWDCPQCGTHHDRDVNAAINIRNEGMRLANA